MPVSIPDLTLMMPFEFHHLQGTSPDTLCQVFNEAFSDYVIPLQLNLSLLQQKMAGENIQLPLSAGAFSNKTLCGFILHGRDAARPHVLYNGGTGVIPAARNNNLVEQLYAHFIPSYRQQGISNILLEVITTNHKAIKAYQNTGFQQLRLFDCFKGNVSMQKSPHAGILIQKSPLPPHAGEFADQVPSWSNSNESIIREKQHTTTWVAILDEEIVGFISVFLASGRIRQIGVRKDMRHQRIGTALLQHAATALGNIQFTIINVEETNRSLISFLEQAGMHKILSQFEMGKEI